MKLLLATGIGAVSILSLVFHTCEREPNDTLETASPLLRRGAVSDGPRGNGVLALGLLGPGDVDHYSFLAREGEVVTVALRDDTGGELADAVLALYGPEGDDPIATVDDVAGDLAPRLAVEAPRGGRYTLAVAGFGDEELDGGDHEERFAYRLAVAVSARPPTLEESDRRGANDEPRHPDTAFLGGARLVPRGAAVLAGSLVPGDVDHYLLPLAPGAVLTASLYDDANGEFNDPVLRLLDRRGELLAEDDDAGPGLLARIVFREADRRGGGPLVLAVDGYDPDPEDDAGHEESFDYRLVVSVEDDLERTRRAAR